MENSGPATSNVNPDMDGVTYAGGDNENQKPMDPSGPAPRTMLTEMEQSGALAAGSRAADMFPKAADKSPDDTYR